MCERNVVGYWVTEKKRQKFNWSDFRETCAKEGLILKLIDINLDLEEQGPIHVFVHKLTDILARAERGDENSKKVIMRVQEYKRNHPAFIVVDPLENIRHLMDRYRSYEILRDDLQLKEVFIPNFVRLQSKNMPETLSLLRNSKVKFPCLCKPLVAHGSRDAHKMMVIFDEKGLMDCQMPCVIQDLVNHNAILYKLFIVGEHFHVTERPSLKNFYPKDCASMKTIFFSSHDISKSGSNSKWSIISEDDVNLRVAPQFGIFEKISKRIVEIFGLILVGVDVVIENHTERYAIIDVNVFPGYDGFPNFFQHLTGSLKKLLQESRSHRRGGDFDKCLSEDFDSGFESDEKKKRSMT